jgi:hypothetical protein
MKQLTIISDDPSQNFSFSLDDGSVVQASWNYVPGNPYGYWNYSLSYAVANWAVNNQQIVNSPNLLRKYRNVIPFGLSITTIDGYEIINQSDFVSGRASVFVLNPDDILAVETLIGVTLPSLAGIPLYQL